MNVAGALLGAVRGRLFAHAPRPADLFTEGAGLSLTPRYRACEIPGVPYSFTVQESTGRVRDVAWSAKVKGQATEI